MTTQQKLEELRRQVAQLTPVINNWQCCVGLWVQSATHITGTLHCSAWSRRISKSHDRRLNQGGTASAYPVRYCNCGELSH